jgi:hypothetical protein
MPPAFEAYIKKVEKDLHIILKETIHRMSEVDKAITTWPME